MKTTANIRKSIIISMIAFGIFNIRTFSQETAFESESQLLDQAQKFESEKNYKQAEKIYAKVIELNPLSFKAFDMRGMMYTKLEKYGKALYDFSVAIELQPENPEVYNHTGIAFYQMRDFETAIVYFNKAIELDAHYAKAFYNRGLANINIDERAKAYSDIKAAADMNYNLASDLFVTLEMAMIKQ